MEILEKSFNKLVLKHQPKNIRLGAYLIIGIGLLLLAVCIYTLLTVGQISDGGIVVIALVFNGLGIYIYLATPVIIYNFCQTTNNITIEYKYWRKTKIIKKSIDEILRVDLKELANKSFNLHVIILIFKNGEEITLNPDNSQKEIAKDTYDIIRSFLNYKNN
jgi:hypothetical protein